MPDPTVTLWLCAAAGAGTCLFGAFLLGMWMQGRRLFPGIEVLLDYIETVHGQLLETQRLAGSVVWDLSDAGRLPPSSLEVAVEQTLRALRDGS